MPKIKTGEGVRLTHVVSVLLTREQYRAIRRRAAEEGRALSGHLRWLAMQDAEAHGYHLTDVFADEDEDEDEDEAEPAVKAADAGAWVPRPEA